MTAASNVVVDTISSRLYLGDVFRFWKADQSSALVTFGTSALGAEFAMPIRTTQLYVAQYMGVGGVTVPQAELDVAGSIRCSLSLVAGNIDVVDRLLTHTTALAGKLLMEAGVSSERHWTQLLSPPRNFGS